MTGWIWVLKISTPALCGEDCEAGSRDDLQAQHRGLLGLSDPIAYDSCLLTLPQLCGLHALLHTHLAGSRLRGSHLPFPLPGMLPLLQVCFCSDGPLVRPSLTARFKTVTYPNTASLSSFSISSSPNMPDNVYLVYYLPH